MKTKNYIRQVVGIDVSLERLDVCLSVLDELAVPHIIASTKFDNNASGINLLMDWIKRKRIDDTPLQVVLEATAVYHERVAHTLYNKGYDIAIVMPVKIKHFCNSTNMRSITDKISARQIAEFGLLKTLKNWKPSDLVIRNLRNLMRERSTLQDERTMVKNQMHALRTGYDDLTEAIKRSEKRIKIINQQISQIELDVKSILNDSKNDWLKAKIKKIITIPGVAFITAVGIIAETDGFNLIHSSRQLVCYAGYDVIIKESGSSVKKKTKISHRGNKYLRKLLYFPALSAKTHNPLVSAYYDRLFDRQQIKMQTYVAIQRKLLVLIYTLWKKDEEYNPNFIWTGKAVKSSGKNQIISNSLSDRKG